MTTSLEFTGEPFDALALDAPEAPPAAGAPPAPEPAPAPGAPSTPEAPTAPELTSARVPALSGTRAAGLTAAVRELRISVARAHEAALRANAALTRRLLVRAMQDQDDGARTGSAYCLAPLLPVPASVVAEARFKPLARTAVTTLGPDALARLGLGDVTSVFGPTYADGVEHRPVHSDHCFLSSVEGLIPHGGAWRRGGLTARTVPLGTGPQGSAPLGTAPLGTAPLGTAPFGTGPLGAAQLGEGPLGADGREPAVAAVVAAATEAAQVMALSLGLHLCLADATLSARCPGLPEAGAWTDAGPVAGPVELRLDVTSVDLVPRPHLMADAEVLADGVRVGSVRGILVAVVERPGVPIGPERGGTVPRWLGRRGAAGEPALLSEFHLAHCCRGDQGIAFGPEFARYTGRKATRPPDGGLLLVDRLMELDGERGVLDRGTYRTEYDSPADSWYYLDSANASMPHCVYMETSLQSALLLGYYLGPTLAMPDENISLRNLGGTATVLREVDLRDKTITGHASLLSTSLVPGSSLQSFSYTQSTDGEAFYQGETLFGYFSDAAMANQTGLDAGRPVPTWLETATQAGAAAGSPGPAARTIDVAARRASPAAPLVSRGCLALLDSVRVVDGGGKYGLGYLWSSRAIDPSDWVFARHFRYDPVIPGSFGVEAVIQAMQEWLLDGGLGDGLRAPAFVLPAGVPFTWKYRGQFLPTDRSFTLEVHIKSLQHRRGRVRVIGEASLWKPGLRIYHLTGVATELREEGAPPWTE